MSIKELACMVGIHDWHLNDRKCSYQIKKEVADELDPREPGEHRANLRCYKWYEDKVCLNCGKEVDEISKFRQEYKERMLTVQQLGGTILPKKYGVPPAPPQPPKKA